MSEKDAKKTAEQYLKEQAKVIEKHGGHVKLGSDKYKAVLAETKTAFQRLSSGKA